MSITDNPLLWNVCGMCGITATAADKNFKHYVHTFTKKLEGFTPGGVTAIICMGRKTKTEPHDIVKLCTVCAQNLAKANGWEVYKA